MFEGWWPLLMDLLQIAILATGVYWAIMWLKGTRAAQMLLGVGALFLAIALVTAVLDLDVVNVLLRWVSIFLLLALLVVFQPELRRMLVVLGQSALARFFLWGQTPETPAERVVAAVRALATRRLGALVVLERAVALDRWCETGTALDARFGEELLISIFTPPLPLHDGAAIVRGDRIRAARCILPIDNELRLEGVGTRHRAAVTFTQECDAVVLVVSEERGQISVAREGHLYRDLADRNLLRLVRAAFVPPEQQRDFFHTLFGPAHELPWPLRRFGRARGKEPRHA